MEYQSQIENYLDNDVIITGRWLATTFHISLNESKALMNQYKNLHKDITATYIVIGLVDSIKSVVVVNESQYSETLKKFKKVFETQLFSIQRLESSSLGSQLYAADLNQTTEILRSFNDSKSEYFLKNQYASIQLDGLKVNPPGEKFRDISLLSGTKSTANIESTEEYMNRMFSNRSTAPKKVVTVNKFFSESSSNKKIADKKVFEETKGNLSNKEYDDVIKIDENGITEDDSPSAVSLPQPGDDEEEWDDGSATVSKSSNKRNRSEVHTGLNPIEIISSVSTSIEGADIKKESNIFDAKPSQQIAHLDISCEPIKKTKMELVPKVRSMSYLNKTNFCLHCYYIYDIMLGIH